MFDFMMRLKSSLVIIMFGFKALFQELLGSPSVSFGRRYPEGQLLADLCISARSSSAWSMEPPPPPSPYWHMPSHNQHHLSLHLLVTSLTSSRFNVWPFFFQGNTTQLST